MKVISPQYNKSIPKNTGVNVECGKFHEHIGIQIIANIEAEQLLYF